MSLIVTPGAADANSYATEADAIAYHATHPFGETWADAENKESLLITATRLLDENIMWAGYKRTQAQALEWPRSGAYDRGGYLISADIVPTAVRDAVCEYARQLADAGTLPNSSSTAGGDIPAGLTGLKAGSVSLTFDASRTQGASASGDDDIPPRVLSMVAYLIASRSTGQTSVAVYRA